MRKIKLVTGECYHVFNRGVDKRMIFLERQDKERFFKTMGIFNSVIPVGSLYEYLKNKEKQQIVPLVDFIAYVLMDNHFHFILYQKVESGISRFMKQLIGGYSWYFNNKYQRSGTLFEGRFKAIHIDSSQYLLYVSAYINLNNEQNTVGDPVANSNEFCSWNEYIKEVKTKATFCMGKNLVLDQFSSSEEYQNFALSALEEIKANKARYKLLGR